MKENRFTYSSDEGLTVISDSSEVEKSLDVE